MLLGFLPLSSAFPQLNRTHIALLGEVSSAVRLPFAVPAMGIFFFETVFFDDFWLRFGFPAMGISVLKETLFFGLVFFAAYGPASRARRPLKGGAQFAVSPPN